jgi:MoaA/NifB/PqqE/SkfB family radical SAM enzyme
VPGPQFLLRGAKRIFDAKAVYAQLVITDDCNLSCSYCNEYLPGAPPIPLPALQARVDKLAALGVLVYDLLGGEPLLHPDLVALIRYVKARQHAKNFVVLITNGFLLNAQKVAALNDAGLDMMQISVDSIVPTASSPKALKTVLPKLHMLARVARFRVKVQSVLTAQTCRQYDEFRRLLADLPFDFGFSLLHGPGGRLALQGDEFVRLLTEHHLFPGMRLYQHHAEAMLSGQDSPPWKCLGGSKFLYINAAGEAQFCSQNREFHKPLLEMTLADLRANNRHKACEAGCALGCVRQVSHALGEPLKTLKTSLTLVASLRPHVPPGTSLPAPVTSAGAPGD